MRARPLRGRPLRRALPLLRDPQRPPLRRRPLAQAGRAQACHAAQVLQRRPPLARAHRRPAVCVRKGLLRRRRVPAGRRRVPAGGRGAVGTAWLICAARGRSAVRDAGDARHTTA